MTAFLPAAHVRGASERLVRSGLPHAPAHATRARPPFAGASRRALAALLTELAEGLRPKDREAELEPAPAPQQRDEDPYGAWEDAAALAADALSSWRCADVSMRSETHAVYRAALDREEAAARELRRSGRSRRR
jgi:hypothetical protein